MPRVMRRTPESEKAAAYGYGGLLKDIVRKISSGATREVGRMTSGGLSKEELLEMALAPAGGMLKVAGTSKLLAGLLKSQAARTYWETAVLPSAKMGRRASEAVHAPGRKAFREALKIPSKEYRRIRDIDWSERFYRGSYTPRTQKVQLNPLNIEPGTPWHEFTHARQWSPEKGEEAVAGVLKFLNQRLAAKSKGEWGEFYHQVSPIEEHARNVAVTMVTGSRPSEFSRVYLGLLESALKGAEKRLGFQEAKEVWELFVKGKEVL